MLSIFLHYKLVIPATNFGNSATLLFAAFHFKTDTATTISLFSDSPKAFPRLAIS